MEILGKMKVDYVSQKSGKRVVGSNIWVSDDITSPNGLGKTCDKVYVSDSVIHYNDIQFSKVELFYNKYGQVQQIKFLGDK